MKGKRFNFKIVLSLLLVGVAGFCFGVSAYPREKQKGVFAAGHEVVEIDNGNYSAMFSGDVIFSAEKVLVSNIDADKDGYMDSLKVDADEDGKLDPTPGVNTFLAADNKEITFQDIYDERNLSTKTVVKDGEFVKLDNYYKDTENKYYDFNSVEANKQQAVLLSFGAYVYFPEKVNEDPQILPIPEHVLKNSEVDDNGTTDVNDDEDVIAGITYLEVVMRHNGEDRTGLKIREIKTDDGLYFDFSYLILQGDTNEGYYELNFKYMIKNRMYTENFSFYIINNLSYTRQVGNTANGYTAKPTLGWTDGTLNFERTEVVNEYVQYNIGDSGMGLTDLNPNYAFPSITYDYTRYKLHYTLSANRKTTTYDYQVVFNSNKTEAYLECCISSVGGEKTVVYDMLDYNKANNTNLVSIILTESGYYVADYEFLYDGYASATAPTPDFETKTIKLEVNGFSAYYSKAGVEGAKLQYFEIARNIGNQVDIIIPNAYEIDAKEVFDADETLGFAYKTVDFSATIADGKTNPDYDVYREGNVIYNKSVNSEILKGESNDIYSNLITEDGVLTEYPTINASQKSIIESTLGAIEYVESNQGSMSVKSSDIYFSSVKQDDGSYEGGSFYYYSPTRISIDALYNGLDRKGYENGIRGEIDNTTTFNKKGYYLVFVQVNSNTLDDGKGSSGYKDYYQIFAFRYTSISINMETSSGEALNKGNYTNESVRIEWKTPGLFDSKIKPYYFAVKNQNVLQEEIVLTTKNILPTTTEIVEDVEYTVASLGGDVKYGEFVKYVVRLENEGRSATEKMFVVDKQPITGIAPYVVQAQYSINSSIFYSFAPNALGEKIRIENSITNGYATFLWDDKASGAGITVKYSYTPFVADASQKVEVVAGLKGESWVTTNYSLGSTIAGQNLNKSASSYNVAEDCVLDDQGIYWLTFTDDAGNTCDYAFIIDRTENWFIVDGSKEIKNGSYLSASSVAYQVGNRKVFDLSSFMSLNDADLKDSEKTIKNFIAKAANNSVNTIENYYSKDNANASVVAKYFEQVSNKYYFAVQNLGVTAYDNTGVIDTKITLTSGMIVEKESNKNEFKRTLEVNSENALYSRTENINSVTQSYVTIVINTDNALGSVFFSSTPGTDGVPELDSDGTYTKMDLGKNAFGADSTSAKHVSFVWKKGTGVFEVATVELDFYELKIQGAQYENGKDALLNHYQFVESTILYGGDVRTVIPVGSDRLLYRFNGELLSKEGLYCVRRTYKGYDPDADQSVYGEDRAVREYFFIVDRNNIIDINNKFTVGEENSYLGEQIKLLLQENAVKFNDFSQINTDSETLYFSENNNQVTKRYNIYLKTNRLPAMISIPLEKYFHSALYNGDRPFEYKMENNELKNPYYAGNLNVQVFYADTENQFIGSQEVNKIIEIFNTKTLYSRSELYKYITSDGIFNLDINKYLNYVGYNINFVNKLCNAKNGNWIYLPGDYIIRITDNTRDEIGNPHEKIIAIKIDSNNDIGPQAELKYGHNEDNLWTLDKNESTRVTVTTSQKYLQVVLTAPNNEDAYNAQLDQSYLWVERAYGSSGFVDYNGLTGYVNLSGFANSYNYVVKNEDGSYSVKLDTMLDEQNLQESLTKRLEYRITLRYVLGNAAERERYKECYHYYNANGQKIYYYESIYTIIVDRMAPSDNIDSLNANDALIRYYCAEQTVANMFERAMYDSGEQLYFTYQYAKYYQAKQDYDSRAKQYLYVYHVDANTTFSMKDVYRVYVKSLGKAEDNDIKNVSLSLPLYSTASYMRNELDGKTISSYSNLQWANNSVLEAGSYYEIIEQDAAGNVTQYIIAYGFAEPTYELPVKVVPINDNLKDVTITPIVQSLDVFSIEKDSNNSSFVKELFFKITLTKNNALVKSWLTNLATNFEGLGAEIVDAINANSSDGKNATFRLSFVTRKLSKTTTISLYKDTNVVLYASDLVVNNEIIILNRANKDSVYATEIRVYEGESLTTYTSNWNNGELHYMSGDKEETVIKCEPGVTYSVTLVSVLGTTSTYRFIGCQLGNVWHSVEFDGGHGYSVGDHYYGFANAKLVYNSSIYDKVRINGNEKVDSSSLNLIAEQNKLVEFRIDLTARDTKEITTIWVTIDKRMGSVVLSNTSVGILGDGYLGQEDNVEIEKSIAIQKIATGALTLGWNEVENNYFDYVYILYGLNPSKEVKLKVIFNSELYYGLVPNENYSTYRFEIRVYQKGKVNLESLLNGTISLDQLEEWYIGNRVYAFDVKLSSNIFYEVRLVNPDEDENPTVAANAKFNLEEIISVTEYGFEGIIKTIFNVADPEKYAALARVNYDLYLSYRELYLVTIDAESEAKLALKLSADKTYFEYIIPSGFNGLYSTSDLESASLVVYEIIKSGISNLYVGILKINKETTLVGNVKLVNGTAATYDVQDITSYIVYGDATIRATVKEQENIILQKNTLTMDIMFIDKYVKSVNVPSGEFVHNIMGNGEYSFTFRDLAGNVHLYDDERLDALVVNVVREVNVTINGEAPVAHAIYNNAVDLIVYKSQIYNAGSVEVEAYRNGSRYIPAGTNPKYTFSDYGNYRVIVTAKYSVNKNEDPVTLTKTVNFSILNINEARVSVDLTSMSGNTLIKVLNQEGKNVVNAFRTMMNSAEYGGTNISYDSVLANATALGVTSGKIKFIVQYEVKDENYPTRFVEFGFTLNNETPKIQCTLKTGESTKKNFSIFFNPQIIYEQVGDAGVYINGQLVATIDENAANEELRISRSFKEHGSGDYYISLVSSSGLILDSYKVVIKEPLNTGAIILIIVITAVVATVVAVIIVLRRKMRIR